MFWQSHRKLQLKMLKLFLFLTAFSECLTFTINSVCGNGTYQAILKEVVYSCYITNLNSSSTNETVEDVIRTHELTITNFDVRLVKIHNQTCHEIPEKLGSFFSKADGLEVINSGLLKIKKEDLKDLTDLKYLNLMKNRIECLSEDLFQNNLKLQFIIICCNQLKIIDNSIFDQHLHIKHLNLRRNVCLSKKSEDKRELSSLRKEVEKKCPPSIEVYCTFEDQDFPVGDQIYTCEVRFWIVVIDYMTVEEFQGRHDAGRVKCNVKGLRVLEMTTKYLPINLRNHFPKLEAIEVVGGRMTRLEKRDVRPYPHLKVLWLPRNNIETLSNDVFEKNLKLEKISLYENRLKFIGSEVFKPLKRLGFVSLELNECIDRFASTRTCIKSMKKEIEAACQEI